MGFRTVQLHFSPKTPTGLRHFRRYDFRAVPKDPNSQGEESSLSVTIQRRETDVLLQIEDAVNVTSAEELKSLLLQGLVSGRTLHVNLEHVQEIDVTAMQLLWVARREADRKGIAMVVAVSEAAAAAARELGFERFPGTANQE